MCLIEDEVMSARGRARGWVFWFGRVSKAQKRSRTESESIVAVVGHHVAWCMAYLSESRIR